MADQGQDADEVEGVNAARLRTWVAERGIPLEGELSVERLSGGSSNLTFRVRDDVNDWVLRRPPLRGALPTAHDMGREFIVQQGLAGSEVPVARVVALCREPAVIGADFYLMDYVEGVFHTSAAACAALRPEDAAGAAFALIDTMAALQAVDPVSVGLEGWAPPEPYLDRQLRRWRSQWERSRRSELPLIDGLLDRLVETRPDPRPPSIVHGDYNLANVMFQRDQPARVAAVLDWELSTLGEPLADLGQLVAYWGGAGRLLFESRGGHLPDANPGFPSASELVARYEQVTGRQADALDWFEVFATVKLAIIVAGAQARLRDQDPERADHSWGLVRQLAEIASALPG